MRVSIRRSCSTNRSAISESRARASSSRYAIGSSDTFPLVMTSGLPTSASSRWWIGEYGSITPRSRDAGATAAATAVSALRRASTIGRWGDSSSRSSAGSRSTSSRAHARSRAINANGLSSRCLRARSSATAASLSARHATWKPPSPLIATIAPASSARAAASMPSRPRRGRAGQPHHGTALGAGVRLRVKAAVARVLVLAPARRAHREGRHRRIRPVVRDVTHDREARPAVRAVRERVAKAAVRGVEQLGEAVRARGGVRRDRRLRLAAARALADREAQLPGLRQRLRDHALHLRERRGLRRHAHEEAVDRLGRRLHLHDHPARVVEHVPGDSQLTGQPVHVRPEPHPLHRALDAGADAAHATSSRSTWYALACASWMRGMCSERVTTTWSASRSAATRPPS